MRKLRRMRRFVFAAAAMCACSMVGSSWAYWSQEIQAVNEYQLAKYNTSIVERFVSPDAWMPGSSVEKNVTIKNDGTLPVFVKLELNQKWIRTENVYDLSGKIIPPAKDGAFPLIFDGSSGKEYAAQIKWGSNVALLASGRTSTASLSQGLPVASTVNDAKGKWLLMSETPDANGNYTLYYGGMLDAGTVSSPVIESVRMNGNIRASILGDNTVWDKQKQVWVTTSTINPNSYENARYTLSVTMYTVQGTKDAVTETFMANGTVEQAVISQLGALAGTAADINFSRDDTVKSHMLYFEEVDGRMVFTPVRNGNQNWFMSDLNMLPGGDYAHTLNIENRSQKTYDLYMQAVPLSQDVKQDELLEYIFIRVYNGSELLYDGRASGNAYAGRTGNLQNVVPLGTYKAAAKNEIKAELILHKDTPIEYAGVLTSIDWKFMVEEQVVPTPTPSPTPTGTATPTPVPMATGSQPPYGNPSVPSTGTTDPKEAVPYGAAGPTSPKTGDDGIDASSYMIIMTVSALCLVGCVIFLIATRRRRYEPAAG